MIDQSQEVYAKVDQSRQKYTISLYFCMKNMLTLWHLREIFKNYFHAIRIIYFDSIYVYNYLNIL